jgi:hypothetical protein
MSWSDDPTAQAGGQGQRWRQLAELDLALRPTRQASQQPQQGPGQVHSGKPEHAYPGGTAGQAPIGYPGQPAAQPVSYHYPHPQSPAFVAPPPLQGNGHSPYAPQFDRYAPGQPQSVNTYGGQEPAHATEHSPFPPRPTTLHDTRFPPLQPGPPTPGLRQPLAGGAVHEPHPELRGATYDHWPPRQEPGSYDLGSYMPPGVPNQRAYEAHPQSRGMPPHADPHWPDDDGFGMPVGDPAAARANHHQPYPDNESLLLAGQPQDHEDTDYEVEEPRRSYRGAAIAVALVGAIVSGGGLAYAYKTLVGPATNTVAPVVKADKRPAKTQPADPGGKQFAHQESKLMGRLGEESGNTASPQLPEPPGFDTDASGVRKVATVVVGRDGSIAAPAIESAPRLPPPMVEVPGMMIVDGFGGRGSVALSAPRRPIELVPQAAGPARGAPATPTPAVVRPQLVSKVNAVSTPAGLGAELLAPQAKKVQRATPTAALQTSPPVATGTGPAIKTGTAGYVVVLSSQKSRMDALKTFADLQQKYGSVLENKIPDVREADLSARGLGTVYRIVVGPPGSREAANGVCDRLKSAGFTGCWVTAH